MSRAIESAVAAPPATKTFDDPTAYDADIRKVVPGYELMHALVSPTLQALLGASARVLVVGCGTGQEVVNIARAQPLWRVDAVDESFRMAEAARHAADRAGVGSRVRIFAHALSEHTERDYDAVVCLLVGHFIADDGSRLTFMGDLASRLRVRGVLLLAELADDREMKSSFRQALLDWAGSGGASRERLELFARRLETGFSPLTIDRLRQLAASVSLGVRGTFFRALSFAGYVLIKEPRSEESL